MKDFRNSNGLVNGKIPAGKPCPFYKECEIIGDNCPTDDKVKPNDFSCGCARAFNITRRYEDD